MNMKIKNEDILSKIEKLIVEGVNITKNAQESEAIYKIKNNDSVKFLAAVFHRYSVWKQKIKKLLNKEKIAKEIDIGILYEGNSVPDIRPGGIEYGDIQSEKSQELLRNIRIETSKKLDWLRQIKIKLSDKQKIGLQNKFPHILPSGTIWENITMQFLDDEKVFIKAYKYEYTADYKEFGCKDRRNQKPDLQWILLRILSKNRGEISWKSAEAKDNIKKLKERLSKKLKYYFAIDYDPFWPYKSGKSYKIKITLLPVPIEKDKDSTQKENELGTEIDDLFKSLIVDDRK